MGSKTFDGVRFAAYLRDHPPPHVHASYAGIEVVLELDFRLRIVKLAERFDSVRPRNAKTSDVAHTVATAAKYLGEIEKLWLKAQA